MDKKINIGVNKQEYDTVMRSVSSDAKKLASDMIRSAREQEKSSSEVIRSIKEQIRLLQEKQRILRDTERSELSTRLSSGQISEAKHGAGQVVIGERSNRDDRLIKEVKNVIDAIKSSSKEEIREDRKSTETHINSLRKGRGVGAGSNEFDNLREISADSQINKQQQRNTRAGMNPIQAYGMGEGMAGGNVPMGALGALGGGKMMGAVMSSPYGIAATVAAIIGGAAFKGEDVAAKGLNDFNRVGGFGNSKSSGILAHIRNMNSSKLSDMGVDAIDSWDTEADLMRSSGGRVIKFNDLINSIAITKSRDVDMSQMKGMYDISRYGGSAPTETVGNMESFLRNIERPMSQLPELMNQYLQTSNQIMSSQGSVNGAGVQGLIAGVTSSYGVEGANIGRKVRALSFVGSRQNKVAGASHLQIRAARKVLGNQASLYDIDLMRDNPSHPKYQEYMKELTGNMMSMRGGGEGAARVMEQAFGGTQSLTEIDKMIKGGQVYTPGSMSGGDKYVEMYQKNANDLTSVMTDWKTSTGVVLKDIATKLGQIISSMR